MADRFRRRRISLRVVRSRARRRPVDRFSRRGPVVGSGRHSTPDGPGYGPYDPSGPSYDPSDWLSVTYSTAVRVWTATDSSKSSTVMYSFWLPMLCGYGP